MKTNIQVKDEPVEFQVNELLRLYAYNLTNQSSTKSSRTKSVINQEQEPSTCAWCQKLGIRSFTLRTDNGDSKTLCSEVCFNQYRRASFKKNKGSESEVDHNILPIVSTIKHKSTEKKNGNDTRELIDTNRRKLLVPFRRPTPTIPKIKTNGITQKCSPISSTKRHRSSSSSSPSPSNGKIIRVDQAPLTTSNLPISLAWQPSVLLPSTIPWPAPVDINRFQYPFFAPPPPPPIPPPFPIAVSDPAPSTLFTTLSKGTLSNFTCILPTFIPLPIPIPIPLCFPIHLPCVKCSTEVNDQQSQTITEHNTDPKRTRRISI